jgi:hypothetical protein
MEFFVVAYLASFFPFFLLLTLIFVFSSAFVTHVYFLVWIKPL